ncbi:protein mesh-like isoform X1 [Scylla paramamosain]|uniref:protein mesh-like isoform X1 n=1 Tax=Scylla paramamosain TaxID=85552 RepID=UPI0030833FF3
MTRWWGLVAVVVVAVCRVTQATEATQAAGPLTKEDLDLLHQQVEQDEKLEWVANILEKEGTYDPMKSRVAPAPDGGPPRVQRGNSRVKRSFDDFGNDPMMSRMAPRQWQPDSGPYAITAERLKEIRAQKMYPYFDADQRGGNGDLEVNINTQNTQVNKQLNFLLPFFGFGLNYTWVSLNGYLGFSDAPFNWANYPLSFPVQDWPTRPDPSFIGPFYSKCNIGELRPGDDYSKRPGVYWRMARDLPSREDQFSVELRERLMWDIREGMVGTAIFRPKHAIIVTWKNVTFAGGSVNTDAKFVTNTFQLVVATDEIRTYTIFNYDYMSWTSHTEAGGSTDEGQGGVPAFVGFNAGNGTRSYEYTPYSQKLYIRDLAVAGNANGFPGRHMFRVDEKILAGCCRREEELKEYPLTFSPEQGNMLGGTLVNLTGPCFKTSYRLTCQFDTTAVEGYILDDNRATCIMPQLYVSGYVDFSISINNGPYYWKGKFFVETPLTAPEGVWFKDDKYQHHSPEVLNVEWLAGNLTMNRDAQAQISLYGYREISIKPEIVYIDMLVEGIPNTGSFVLTTADFMSRDNRELLDLEMGLVMINLTIPEPLYGLEKSTAVWSRPVPLAWYFRFQWERVFGSSWPSAMCDRWIENDRNLRNFAYEVERCPCLLQQAVADKGRFLPDFSCDKDGNTQCDYHFGAIHCVRTALPNEDGAGQQCCYDRDGYLMMTADKMWGGNPHRAHNLGKTPFDEANKVPSLSHWYHDVIPFYTCCKWQGEQSPGCVTYRFERRASQDCVGYQPPTAATVFGDPHIYTFDDFPYTFNGKGEFVLARVDSVRHKLDVQGRFEQISLNYLHEAKGSMLTAVAARDNISSVVEVRQRPIDAIWRYHLDVIVDGQRVYFDRYSQKIQQFRECVVYTPSNVLNQSHVIIMFASGAGVEVMENRGFLGTRIYLPLSFANITRGLFGNWTFDQTDDFTLPDGTLGPASEAADMKAVHTYGMQWVLDDKERDYVGRSLFNHDNYRSSNYYYDADFVPELNLKPDLSVNATTRNEEIKRVCGDSYQCHFDFVVTLRRDFADMTKYYQDQFVNIKQVGLVTVVSCGALPTPPNGRKSTFNFLSGAEVKFDCDPGYVLLGEQRRWCYASGDWNWPEDGEATCVSEAEYLVMQGGITAGTVLAVLIPVLIALLCFTSYLRNKERYEAEAYAAVVPLRRLRRSAAVPAPRPSISRPIGPVKTADYSPVTHREVFTGSPSPQKLFTEAPLGRADDSSSDIPDTPSRSSLSDSDSYTYPGNASVVDAIGCRPMRIPKDFDAVYDTHEPVDNKPVVFQNVMWDLESETQKESHV